MDDREKLYPTCGRLHPEGLARLAKCEDYDQVKAVADCYPVSLWTDYLLYGTTIIYCVLCVVCRNILRCLLELVLILERRLWKTSSLRKRCCHNIQWNLSNQDTVRQDQSVLNRDVPSIQ